MIKQAHAPGKLLLLGEYAVLEGAPAIVAAVNRRAHAWPDGQERGASPVVRAARAAAGGGPWPRIDTGSFQDAAGRKLGLGSSAVSALLTVALARGSGDEETLSRAVAGHRDAFGGEGSGVDVAASYTGGVIAARRQPGPIEPLPSRLQGLFLFVLFTGESAHTSELVSAARGCARWTEWSQVLRGLAEEGLAAYRRQAPRPFLGVVARYARALGGLGRDAGAPILTERLEALTRWAEEAGGAAKPSGAGGGDVAVAWGADRELGPRLAEKSGAQLLDLAVDPRGLSLVAEDGRSGS